MQKSFGSCCHGAGRVLSRSQAKRQIRGDQLIKSMAQSGITVLAGSLSGLTEEAPAAYKNVDLVIESAVGAGLAKKVAHLRPLAVIKG
jgi:tRNA-splicing ligase RtcB